MLQDLRNAEGKLADARKVILKRNVEIQARDRIIGEQSATVSDRNVEFASLLLKYKELKKEFKIVHGEKYGERDREWGEERELLRKSCSGMIQELSSELADVQYDRDEIKKDCPSIKEGLQQLKERVELEQAKGNLLDVVMEL